MTAGELRSYRFSTEAQWNACLFEGAERDPRRAKGGLWPYAPYARPATLHETRGAHAPAATRAGEILWRDDAGGLHRLQPGDDTPVSSPAPTAIGHARRMVATGNCLWVATQPRSLQRHEDDTLARLVTVQLEDGEIVDIASGGDGAVLALIERAGSEGEAVWQVARVDGAGHVGEGVTLEGISRKSAASAFVFLRRSRRFVVLAAEPQPRLCWFPAEGGRMSFAIALGAMGPCFKAFEGAVLGSDSRDLVFLAGADGANPGGEAFVVILDADGNRLGDVPLDRLDSPPTGIAATRDRLIVTGSRGLLRFSPVETVPEDAADVQCTVVTPTLQSPEREDQRRWLRIEVRAGLPAGSTLELSFAATDDSEVRDRLNAIASDASLPSSHRVQKLRSDPDVRWVKTVLHGADRAPTEGVAPLSAPLFDVRERYLWACVRLIAGPGARLPSISELSVLYPGRSLMEDLPAIYRRDEAQPGSFLRGLVGVLEATTQGIDENIASLGRRVHPSTAEGPWLDLIARWLGLPWDDGLGVQQKRAIVERAEELAMARGTREGLEALLEALMPGTPRRFRVTDATADLGFAIVGGEECAGSALPALLGGSTPWTAELDARAVLGAMRLPCPGQRDDAAVQFAGRIRIEVAASAEEREAWQPWLLALITEMLPLTARAQLRWVGARSLHGDRLDGTLTLGVDPEPHLGTDAITGLARLPESRTRLSRSGSDVGPRLR
jgi:phage tail-like protein